MDPQVEWVARHKATPFRAVAIDAAFLIFGADNIRRFCSQGFGHQLVARDEYMHVGAFSALYIPQLDKNEVRAHLDAAVEAAHDDGIEHAAKGRDELIYRYYGEGGSALFGGTEAPERSSFLEERGARAYRRPAGPP